MKAKMTKEEKENLDLRNFLAKNIMGWKLVKRDDWKWEDDEGDRVMYANQWDPTLYEKQAVDCLETFCSSCGAEANISYRPNQWFVTMNTLQSGPIVLVSRPYGEFPLAVSEAVKQIWEKTRAESEA